MTREDILNTTQRIRDLHYFYDILTSNTPGAERAWEAMDELNFPNPMALTSYLLENKDFFLRYCDDEGARIRTAKTALLMYTAALDGRTKVKDGRLADIADNKYQVYNSEWNDANQNWSADGAIAVLKGLSLEEKKDVVDDVKSILEADGSFSEKGQSFIEELNETFGLEDDSDFEEKTEIESQYIFAHPGKCRYMPQRLMEATFTDILTRLRLDDPDKRAAFLAMDRSGAEKLIRQTYRDVVSHASPSLMKIVEKEGQGNPKSYAGQFMENLVSKIYDSMKGLQAENGDSILYPDAPDLLKPLPCLGQVLSSAGFLQENMERKWINPGSLRYLKVIGTINAYDFRFLRDECPELMVLDISDALIGDYEGKEGCDENITYYDSLEIPLGAFCYGKIRDGKAGHPSLQVILFHEDTYLIQRGAFQGCSRLDNVFLPQTMKVIDEKAFKDCENLEYVYLGGTELIKNGAFNGCTKLKDIVCPGNPPALGNPNQSPEMKRFATPVFSPHEMDGSGLEVRAIKVPSAKISIYERTEWANVSHISSGEFDGRDFFEMNVESHVEWMAGRDHRMAMWDFITAALCKNDGSFSDSAQKTIIALLKGSLPLNEDDFYHVLKNPDLDRSAAVIGALAEEKAGRKEVKEFFRILHTAITAEGVDDNRIHIMNQALSFIDLKKYEELLGDAMAIYFPISAEETVVKDDDKKVEEKPKTKQKPKTNAPKKKESKKKETAPKESWSVIGSFDSWNKDIDMTKIMDGVWVSPWISCSKGDAIKIRCNRSWEKNLGGTLSALGKSFKAIPDGDNIVIPSQGRYIVTLNTKEQEILLTKENGSDDEKQSKPSPKKSKEEPAPNPVKRTSVINSVKADHNVSVNGKKGVTLHINLDTVHCNGVDCKCGAWLYYSDGKPVQDTNQQYCSTDGQVAASVPFKPAYDNTHFDDLQLFFPYDEFHIKGKDVSCYFSIQVYCPDSGEYISAVYKNSMTYSAGSDMVAKFTRVKLETYKDDLCVFVDLDIKHGSGKDGSLNVWFFTEDGNKLMAENCPDFLRTEDGQLSTSTKVTPDSDSFQKKYIPLLVPFPAFNVSPGRTYRFKLQLGVVLGDEHLPYSDFIDFKVEVKKTLLGVKYKLV
jgi:hypothetical protein